MSPRRQSRSKPKQAHGNGLGTCPLCDEQLNGSKLPEHIASHAGDDNE